jgi:Zn-dependent M28 family amino/carboxypeptidase
MTTRILAVLLAASTLVTAETPTLPALEEAAAAMTAAGLMRTITELASDAYGGRLPGTAGEEKSVAWIVAEAKAIGLAPGAPDGSWVQKVPLIGTRSTGTLEFDAGGTAVAAETGKDVILWSNLADQQIDVRDSLLAFVGYGVVAPEYQWDDYAGLDVRGKTVVVLTGDPPVPGRFLDAALTVHGRAGTKLEQAFKHGAVAVVQVNPTQAAGAPLNLNNARENMTLRDGRERQQVKAIASLTLEKAAELFTAVGADLTALAATAATPGFAPRAVNARASFRITNQVRQFDSQNVFARIEGSDPRLRNEHVIYSGHWDHHGSDGPQIFHGASDNAAGTAGVLELARAFKTLSPAPKRTIVFFWPTAEEKGLLGARWYVDHPFLPLAATVANINLDYFSNWGFGRTRDFSIVGLGNSTLDDLTAEAVARQGRTLTGDTAPEQGFYFRSDHFEFARVGVPSLETSPGIEHIGKPEGYGATKRAEYIRNDYHKETDVPKPDWDLSGAVEDLAVLLEVGYRAAEQPGRPTWKPDAVWRPKGQ